WDFAAVQLQHIKHGWDKDVLSLLCDLGMSKLASTTWADIACVVNQKLMATPRHTAVKANKDNVRRIYEALKTKATCHREAQQRRRNPNRTQIPGTRRAASKVIDMTARASAARLKEATPIEKIYWDRVATQSCPVYGWSMKAMDRIYAVAVPKPPDTTWADVAFVVQKQLPAATGSTRCAAAQFSPRKVTRLVQRAIAYQQNARDRLRLAAVDATPHLDSTPMAAPAATHAPEGRISALSSASVED
ncbi:hypothetical protein SDRG_11216, partial [Saprolegnia diclina VS20]